MAQKECPNPRLLDWSILTSVLLGAAPAGFAPIKPRTVSMGCASTFRALFSGRVVGYFERGRNRRSVPCWK